MSSSISRLKKVPFLGLLICFGSAFLFSVCNVIVQQVSDVDPFTIGFYRFFWLAVPSFNVLLYKRQNPIPKENKTKIILLARCIFGSSNLLIHYYGLKYLPLADANMIAAASPIWCTIFARIFLKEALHILDFVNIFITLSGILFIIKPPVLFGTDPDFVYDSQVFFAAIILFFGSFLQAGVYILLRLLKGIHYSVTLTAFGTVGSIESLIIASIFGSFCIPTCGLDRFLMLSIGLLSFIAQIGLTVSLQLEEASKVSVMRKAGDILFAFLFQILLFNDKPGVWSICGACLVGLAVLISSLKKVAEKKPKGHWMVTVFCIKHSKEET